MQTKHIQISAITSVLVATAIAFYGCGSDDSGGTTGGGPDGGGTDASAGSGGTSGTGGSGGATAGTGGSAGSGGSGGSSAGTGGTTSTDGGSGSTPRCPPGQILCNDTCTDVSSDGAHCGSCDTPCANGVACVSGVCGGDAGAGCPPGMVDCGGDCRDLSNDPEFCGSCMQTACADTQFCQDGECRCRPELTDCGGDCVDTQTDPNHCGGCDSLCDQTCVDGTCTDAASCGGTVCDGACVDTDTNPLHCGACDSPCAVDQVCFSGQCWDYEPTLECTSCADCSACGGAVCCDLAGYGVACVDTDQPCP